MKTLLFAAVSCLVMQIVFSTVVLQSAGVKGRLMCGTKPAANVQVKLVDEDTGPDPDDVMDNGYTDSQGYFELSGSTSEISTIDPRLKIYHNCNDGITPCDRKFTFEIPDKYVRRSQTPAIMDFGTLNLEVKIDHDESRDCIHKFRFRK